MNPLHEQLAKLSPEQRALFEQKLKERGLNVPGQNRIPARSQEGALPLSFAQERLWFVQQFDPQNTAYNVSSALRLRGTLDQEALHRALSGILTRHESLRTSFHKNEHGQPEIRVHESDRAALAFIELAGTSDEESEALEKISTLVAKPFDLTTPPLQFCLFHLADDDHILAFVTHHLVCDRWSVMVFMRELAQLYLAGASTLPPLPIQYPDWALWQRDQLASKTGETQLEYWKERLADQPAPLELPTRSSQNNATHQGAHHPLRFGPELSARIRELALKHEVSLFTFLLTAFKALLNRYTGSEDIVVGSEVANRDRPETASLIGLLVNTLVLRTKVSPSIPFNELLSQVQETVKGGLSHQDLPFEKLVEALNPDRQLDQLTPLFQVKFDLQQVAVDHSSLGDLTLEHFPIPETQTKYDLRFNLQEGGDDIFGQIEYRTDRFEQATITRLGQHFINLLQQLITQGDQPLNFLKILSPTESTALLTQSQGRKVPPSENTLHLLFEEQVRKTPQALAIYDQEHTVTYQELDQRAEDFAKKIRALKLPPESRIGVCLPKSSDLIASLFGILKADAAYVALDPDYPSERLLAITSDAKCAAIFQLGSDGIELVSEEIDLEENNSDLPPHRQLAYLIYTSGSTGRPKGVAIEHQAAATMVRWAHNRFSNNELAGVLASTSICFDLSVFEIFVPLTAGGAVVLAQNLLAFPRLPARQAVTLINTVPSLLRKLLHDAELPSTVHTINLAGEALLPDLVEQLFQLGIQRVDNLYGPSEDTTYSTWVTMKPDHFNPRSERVTIGTPIDNTIALVLNGEKELQPVGLPGELHLGGDGLARGYLDRPELTEISFLKNPFGAEPPRLYCTGDKVRWLENGELEFLGRIDQQFKIRGFRIEAGEIEIALRAHPQITEALVMPHRIDTETVLLAYYVPQTSDASPVISDLRAHLGERLPSAMVPSLWHELEEIPRLPNGKLNRKELPEPQQQAASTSYAPAESNSEKALTEIWQDLLPPERIGIHDNFFDLGGHSLLAIQLTTRIEQKFQTPLPLRELFLHPTIAQVASLLEKNSPESLPQREFSQITPEPARQHEPFPLTDIQQAYWLGRSGAFELGNIGTHGYREIDVTGVEHSVIENAFNTLIQRHGMLRMIVQDDGQQRILENTPHYQITLSETNPEARREELSHQVFIPNTWPLFHLEAIRLSPEKTRYLVSFDVLLGDAWSLQVLGREMGQLIMGLPLEPLTLTFRDYVLAEKQGREGESAQRAWTYWTEKIPQLPLAPELPLIKNPREIEHPTVTRRSFKLSSKQWQKLQAQGKRSQITPSALVLTAFSEMLGTWSRSRQFTLNLTLFNRPPAHPEIDALVGDFTSSTLLACDPGKATDFASSAQDLQQNLWEVLEHRAVSGVQVIRELARQRRGNGEALMPVVFTSTLGQISGSSPPREWEAEVIHGVSQTSQVYLDHQVSEIEGELVLNWDVIEELWPAGVLDEMFRAYQSLLDELSESSTAWETRPSLASPEPYCSLNSGGAMPTESHLLHSPFFEQASQFPDAPAIFTDDETLTYAELSQRALALAKILIDLGVQRNELVAISAPRGWEQIVACLGILASGAAYVPINPSLPQTRRHELIADTKTKIVLTLPDGPDDWPGEIQQITLSRTPLPEEELKFVGPLQQESDLAYVIYTSGSTGMPKGVMIDHRGASNTILDLNERVRLTAQDRIFAISSLSFDLSVYDIFGTLTAGAALVMGTNRERSEDPAYWRALVDQHQVTLWNSVPALAQLLASEGSPSENLRTFLLSGDWIPLSLPDALRKQFPKAELLSLGGATEASIWSIIHPITQLSPEWPSVPYGRPLRHQSWLVLDENLQPCPPWVPGKLYIGGIGVALGYWNRPELTASQFIPDFSSSVKNATLYCTGDWGRLRPAHDRKLSLEFLGRQDSQVKINGYRIELGEIEAALQKHSALAQAAVTIQGSPPELIAHLVPDQGLIAEKTISKLDAKTTSSSEAGSAKAIPLPPHSGLEGIFQRQSHRRFLGQTVTLGALAKLLSSAQAHVIEGAALPKRRYPSAGSLYSVDLYLKVIEERVKGLSAGIYRYHSSQHQLEPIADDLAQEKIFEINQTIAEQSAFCLFLVADLAPITAVYGERARDFAHLEAGYLAQLLMEQASQHELGLCPVNEAGFSEIPSALNLRESHLCLHALLGGMIEPSWTERWVSPQETNSQSLLERIEADLAKQLPSYMVPRRFQILHSLPLSANGKIDRDALPELEAPKETTFVAPRTNLEKTVTGIWQDLLELPQVGLNDHFFQLGGNSLQAIQLLGKLRQEGYPSLTIAQLFGALTPSAQVKLLQELPSAEEEAIPTVSRSEDEERSDDEVEAQLRKLLSDQSS